jgi:hypothetical protein
LTDRDRVVRETYAFVEGHTFPDFSVADPSRVAGTIDIHAHTGPGRQHPLELAHLASQAGMRAIVLKDTVHGPSVELVRVLNPLIRAWAEERELTATQLLGSVVLGHDTGGFRPGYVERMIDFGARVIWFPTRDASNHIERARGEDPAEARAKGLSVLDGDELRPEVREILDVIRQREVAVSFGHLSNREIMALAEHTHEVGIERAFVDHPFSPVAALSVENMAALGKLGVTCNFTAWEVSPYLALPATELVSAIREIGPAMCTLSSDSCMEIFPSSVEAMRLHKAMLDVFGFSTAEQDSILYSNQARLLKFEA